MMRRFQPTYAELTRWAEMRPHRFGVPPFAATIALNRV